MACVMHLEGMKTIKLKKIGLLAGAVLVSCSWNVMPLRALDNPINPNAPSPNSGVAPGHRAAGSFTARRPGNLPKYGPRTHAYTGVTKQTP
jgi:hypothetical protein